MTYDTTVHLRFATSRLLQGVRDPFGGSPVLRSRRLTIPLLSLSQKPMETSHHLLQGTINQIQTVGGRSMDV